MRMSSVSKINPADNKNIDIQNAVRKFQKYAGLNQTGIIDDETLNMMRLPRCGHPDNLSKARTKRFVLQGSKWSKSNISFKIGKYPKFSSMSPEDIDREITRAFNLWSEVSDLKFEQIKEPQLKNTLSDVLKKIDQQEADIDVRFETGYHGDAEPFDGSGLILGEYFNIISCCILGVILWRTKSHLRTIEISLSNKIYVCLGHAYFPEFGGSTHFDSDEFWTTKVDDGVDLYQVAVHE